MKNNDEILREAIEAAGYYSKKGFKADLRTDDLSYDDQVKLILARALIDARPDLEVEPNKDLVFIVRSFDSNGSQMNSIPFNCVGEAMKNSTPYDDSEIWSYSISKQEFVEGLYCGNGCGKWKVIK